MTKKIRTPLNFHLSIKFILNRKSNNGNISLIIGRRKKLKMKEQCDEMLKQYGIFGCTDFSFPLKSEHPVSVKPPTHPNPNVVRICKSVWNIGQSLTRLFFTDINYSVTTVTLYTCCCSCKQQEQDNITIYRYISCTSIRNGQFSV